MEVQIVKEIVLNNITIKEYLLKKLNTALFVFRRDFNSLKLKDAFPETLEEILSITKYQLKSKKQLEEVLSELNQTSSIQGTPIEDMDVQHFIRAVGDIIEVENCGETENSIACRVDELLEAL